VPDASTNLNAGVSFSSNTPAPLRNSDRPADVLLPDHGYRMSGGQVPAASTYLNADAGFGDMPTPHRVSGRPAHLRVPVNGYRMSGNQVSDASTDLNAGAGSGISTPSPVRASDHGSRLAFTPTPTIPRPTIPDEDTEFYTGLMDAFSAGFRDDQMSSMRSYTPTDTNVGDASSMSYTATRPNTGGGISFSSAQSPHTPTTSNVDRGFDRRMPPPPLRRHPVQPHAHRRNTGRANRLSLMPPVPPTPANPNGGAGFGSTSAASSPNFRASFGTPDGGAVFDNLNTTRSGETSLSERLESPKIQHNSVLNRFVPGWFDAPPVTGVIGSKVSKSASVQQKKKRTIGKMGDLSIAMKSGNDKQPLKGSYFRFLDLPPGTYTNISTSDSTLANQAQRFATRSTTGPPSAPSKPSSSTARACLRSDLAPASTAFVRRPTSTPTTMTSPRARRLRSSARQTVPPSSSPRSAGRYAPSSTQSTSTSKRSAWTSPRSSRTS
jgi:hypothetical protein